MSKSMNFINPDRLSNKEDAVAIHLHKIIKSSDNTYLKFQNYNLRLSINKLN